MNKLDFSFGEPFILNENLKGFCTPIFKWDYLSYGSRVLPESTKSIVLEMIEQITGVNYTNLIITNGAQDGLNLLLKASPGTYLHVESQLNLPHYSFHKLIADKNNDDWAHGEFLLNTIPNNPTGSLVAPDYGDRVMQGSLPHRIIWDAAYFSNNYIKGDLKKHVPKHDYMVGSFGKTFGVAGLRLGWIASNHNLTDVESSQRVQQLRPNHMSIGIVLQLLNKMARDNWALMRYFFESNQEDIQDNKSLFQSVIDKYGIQPMPENGMFYWGGNEQFKNDLDKLGVLYVDGVECGGQNGELRLNMAVNKEIMQELVTLLLKV